MKGMRLPQVQFAPPPPYLFSSTDMLVGNLLAQRGWVGIRGHHEITG